MKCPFCHSENLKVIDSRDTLEGCAVRRRRECIACSKRFTTFETIELMIQVKKRDGRYQEYEQQKLIDGMQAACSHTKVSRDQIMKIAAKITDTILQSQMNEVSTQWLGVAVMEELKLIDPIAYIRFACVYSRIQDIEELICTIREARPKKDLLVAPGGN